MIADEGIYQMDSYETSAIWIQSSYKISQEYDLIVSAAHSHLLQPVTVSVKIYNDAPSHHFLRKVETYLYAILCFGTCYNNTANMFRYQYCTCEINMND